MAGPCLVTIVMSNFSHSRPAVVVRLIWSCRKKQNLAQKSLRMKNGNFTNKCWEQKKFNIRYKMVLMNTPLQLIMIQWDTGACGRQEETWTWTWRTGAGQVGWGCTRARRYTDPRIICPFDKRVLMQKSAIWKASVSGNTSSFENMLKAQNLCDAKIIWIQKYQTQDCILDCLFRGSRCGIFFSPNVPRAKHQITNI